MTDQDDRRAYDRADSRRDVLIGAMAAASALASLPAPQPLQVQRTQAYQPNMAAEEFAG